VVEGIQPIRKLPGGPHEGGSRTVAAAVTVGVVREGNARPCTSSTGSDDKLGNKAGAADPEHNAQCDEPCLGELGRGKAGAEPGSGVALRLTEQKSSNPGPGVADAYAPSGTSRCAASVTNTTPMRKRGLISRYCTAPPRWSATWRDLDFRLVGRPLSGLAGRPSSTPDP
jgi:hypothetical protein